MILLSWWVIGHWFISCSLKILFLPISHIYSIPNETSKCIFVSSIWHFRHYFWCHLDFIQYSQWTQQIGSFNYILEIFLVIPTRNSICHDPLHPLHISGSMSREANIKMIKLKLTKIFFLSLHGLPKTRAVLHQNLSMWFPNFEEFTTGDQTTQTSWHQYQHLICPNREYS